MLANSTLFLPAPNIAYNSGLIMKLRHANLSHHISKPLHFGNAFFNCNGSKRTAHKALASGAGDMGLPEEHRAQEHHDDMGSSEQHRAQERHDNMGPPEEHNALETVLKLYEAIKNKNVNELSDIIAEECSCVSNFVSAFQPYLGKKQVMAFFSSLMKYLGNNIEIVVQQTSDDGMMVGVSWKLEWTKVPLHLGKGFSFYTCHVYHGKVMIRNVDMFLEPILHMEPLTLKLVTLVMAAMVKLNPQSRVKNRARKVIILVFILLFLAALVYLYKYRLPT